MLDAPSFARRIRYSTLLDLLVQSHLSLRSPTVQNTCPASSRDESIPASFKAHDA